MKHKIHFFSGVGMIAVGTSAALLEPWVFGRAIDEAIVPRSMVRLYQIGFMFSLIVLTRVLAAMQQGYLFEVLGQKVTQNLRVLVFSHIQMLPMSFYGRNPGGRFLTRVTNDIAALNEMFSSGFVTILSNFLLVIGILGWLLVLDFKLGLITASVFPLLAVSSVLFTKKLIATYRFARSKLSHVNSFLAENLTGMKVIHLFNRQKRQLEKFDELNRSYLNAQCSSVRVYAFFQPTITIAAGISLALVIWFGGLDALDGRIKLGILVAYFSYGLSLFQPIREIADKWNTFLSGMAAAERIFAVLKWPVEGEIESVPQPIRSIQGHIEFKNVWFAYEGDNWILKDLSFEILPGEKAGIVGHTGAGKSTIIQLLLRFYQPQRGQILIDGQDIQTMNRRDLRASIGTVQQDAVLFTGSLHDNIFLWREPTPASEAKMRSVLDEMHWNRSQEECLAEKEGNYSVGERQIVAFCRALVKDPKIWILDEATANMDSFTETRLQQLLNKNAEDKTCIYIAHRLATIQNADRILVLHEGSLAEMGTHQELLQQEGLYHKLFQHQGLGI